MALPFLLTVYLPRTPDLGSHFFVYGSLVATVGVLLAVTFIYSQDVDLDLVSVLLWLLAIGIVTSVSLVANAEALRATGSMRVLRPFLYAMLLLYGYQIAGTVGGDGIRSGILLAARLILVGQLVIAASQAAGTGLFSTLYEAEKARQFGGLFRVTGSMANPNWFGWTVAQSSVGILIFHDSRRRYAWLALAAVLVVAAGSRSLLLLFPFMAVVGEGLRANDRGLVSIGPALGAGVSLVAFFGAMLVFLREALPYLGQLHDLFATASLRSINALDIRFSNWANVAEVFRGDGAATWLFGLGDREITQTLDNDYLFVLFRTGAVGLLVHLTFIVYLIVFFKRRFQTNIARFGLEYLLFALAFGLVADTLGGWFLPIWLFLFVGMAMAEKRFASGDPHSKTGNRPTFS